MSTSGTIFKSFTRARADGFDPDGLPDAAAAGVHDAAGLVGLLAARLAAFGSGVECADDQLLRPGWFEEGRDVVAERIVTAFVNADALAVHEDLAFS